MLSGTFEKKLLNIEAISKGSEVEPPLLIKD